MDFERSAFVSFDGCCNEERAPAVVEANTPAYERVRHTPPMHTTHVLLPTMTSLCTTSRVY